jgi:hypothetical protein
MLKAIWRSCLLMVMVSNYDSHSFSVHDKRLSILPKPTSRDFKTQIHVLFLRGGSATDEQTIALQNGWKLELGEEAEKDDRLTEDDFSDCSYEYQEIKPRLRQDPSEPPPILGAQVISAYHPFRPNFTYISLLQHRSGTAMQNRGLPSTDASRCASLPTAPSYSCPETARAPSYSPAARTPPSTSAAPTLKTGPSCSHFPQFTPPPPPLPPAVADPLPAL